MSKILDILRGYKTIIAGIGLIGLGVSQIASGDLNAGLQSILAGIAAISVRDAIAKLKK